MMFLLTCDKKLTKSQLSPTHASTKRKITDELKRMKCVIYREMNEMIGELSLVVWSAPYLQLMGNHLWVNRPL